jgi:hypothetical protein
MRSVLAIGVVTLLLVACSPTDNPCRAHKDEASCLADKACQWKAEKNRCRMAKKGESPQSEQTTTPAPSEQAAPQPTSTPEAPKAEEPAAAPGTNYSSPLTDTQPQPTYPDGQPQ